MSAPAAASAGANAPAAADGTADLPPARVLVVDDQRVHRDKLVQAVRSLGHEAEAVDGGAGALARLAVEPFDLVLLDILMPDMDGFEVMSVMRRDRRLRAVPVIVVSALESEMDSVVRAVEMGAEDMLPKRFDRVLLAARLDAALERRRARARERELQLHMRRLSEAAALLEQRPDLPANLGLGETCRREDAIGRLARVFVHMSAEVRARELTLQRQLARLRLGGLALATAAVLGFAPVLARTALLHEPRPLGVALWLAALCALLCLPAGLLRGRLPRPANGVLRLVLTLVVTGVFGGALPLLWLADELPAGVLAVVLPAEFAVAAALSPLLDGRRPSAWRLAALALGAAAVGVLGSGASGLPPWPPETLAIALLAPLGWALSGHALARRSAPPGADDEIDALTLVGLVALVATLCLAPLAIALGELVPLFRTLPAASLDDTTPAIVGTGGIGIGLVVLLLAATLAAGATLRVLLAREGGAELAAVASLGASPAALGWGAVVLGEGVPSGLWLPLALFAAAPLIGAVAARPAASAVASTPDVELG